MRQARLSLALAVGMVLPIACAGDPSVPPEDVSVGPDGNVVLPADGVELDDETRGLINYARSILLQRCMSKAGFDFPILDGYEPTVRGNTRRYGIADLDTARVHGFGTSDPSTRAAQRMQRLNDYYAELSDQAGIRLMGADDGRSAYTPDSCTGQAEDQLNTQSLDDLADRLRQQLADARTRFLADERLQAANDEWSQCMLEQGYEYPDPIAAATDPTWKEGRVAGAVLETEITAAVRDIECKSAVSYIETVASIEAGHQRRALEDESASLIEVRGALDAARQSALQVIAEYEADR